MGNPGIRSGPAQTNVKLLRSRRIGITVFIQTSQIDLDPDLTINSLQIFCQRFPFREFIHGINEFKAQLFSVLFTDAVTVGIHPAGAFQQLNCFVCIIGVGIAILRGHVWYTILIHSVCF